MLAQDTVIIQTNAEERFDIPDVMPGFPNGLAGLMDYLKTNVRYPARAAQDSIEGRVVVGFVVEKDGSISNVSIIEHADPMLEV